MFKLRLTMNSSNTNPHHYIKHITTCFAANLQLSSRGPRLSKLFSCNRIHFLTPGEICQPQTQQIDEDKSFTTVLVREAQRWKLYRNQPLLYTTNDMTIMTCFVHEIESTIETNVRIQAALNNTLLCQWIETIYEKYRLQYKMYDESRLWLNTQCLLYKTLMIEKLFEYITLLHRSNFNQQQEQHYKRQISGWASWHFIWYQFRDSVSAVARCYRDKHPLGMLLFSTIVKKYEGVLLDSKNMTSRCHLCGGMERRNCSAIITSRCNHVYHVSCLLDDIAPKYIRTAQIECPLCTEE